MLRKVTSPFTSEFSRKGGSLITARLDIWEPTEQGWTFVDEIVFSDPTAAKESKKKSLPKGTYTCVFQCYVDESLNGKYDFNFDVGGKPTYVDEGDVNTTPSPNDSKVYKDQMVLVVK